jgi:hypothetical protein
VAAYVQASDLSPLFPDADSDVVSKWLDKAERRLTAVLQARGCSLSSLAEDPARLDTIRDVLENAVVRVLRNPEGLKSESEGDYSYTANPLDASGSVWFPQQDLDLICPKSGWMGTVQLGLPSYRVVW